MIEEFGLDNDTKIEFFNFILELGFYIIVTSYVRNKKRRFIISDKNRKYFYLLENNNYLWVTVFKKELVELNIKKPNKIKKHFDNYYLKINIYNYPTIRFRCVGLIDDKNKCFDSILIGKDIAIFKYDKEKEIFEDKYIKFLKDYESMKDWLKKRTKEKLVMTKFSKTKKDLVSIYVTDKMEKLIDEEGYLFSMQY